MNYNFNKTLVEQVKAGTHCIEFNRYKDSLEMLQALCKYVWPDCILPDGDCTFYYANNLCKKIWSGHLQNPDGCTPIPLSNFVQPEQSERDVMAGFDERLKRLEDILLRDAEVCKAEPEIVNPVRWRALYCGTYYFVNPACKVKPFVELNNELDEDFYKTGNYFQTAQQAEEMAVLMQFTLNNPELVKQLMDKKE